MIATAAESPVAVAYAARDLKRHYRNASDSRKRRGREWYATAAREARKLSRKHGCTFRQAAAIIAVTSPDAQLSTHLRWASEILEGSRTAGRYPADQAPKVKAILADRKNPGQYATGPKVSAFYLAIIGRTDSLTIDRWASHAAGGPKASVPGPAWRRTFETAYRQAAADTGETVRDFQAIVWTQVRETEARMRLADITK